jgi:hypothetical protein
MSPTRFTALITASCLVLAVAPSAQAKAKPKAFNGKTCTIVGTSKSEKLTGTPKADVICGLGGNDTISGLGGNDTIDGGAGNDILSGGVGNDAIDGGAGNDTAKGENGNDVITGDAGNDSLNGGAGNDTLQGETGADVFIGGAGTDNVKYAEKTKNLTLDIDNKADDGVSNEKDNIKSDVENIIGGAGNDTITGGSAANTINGGAGNDTINGGGGNDALLGANGDDSLNGQGGTDTYDGGNGLNSCYVDEEEQRDFTCSLLPNLTYLLKRVSGEIQSPGYDFAGCDISLYRTDIPGGPVVQAPILSKNRFMFDAPAGNYDWLVAGYTNGRGVGGSSTCNVNPSGITIWAKSQIVSNETPFITFEVPRLVSTRIYVKNSRGTPLKGVLLNLSTDYGRYDPQFCPIVVTNMCGSLGWSANSASDPQPRTNASGYFEVLLPEGVKFKASGTAIFAGITMETNTVQDVVLTYPSTNIDLVIQ